MSKYTSAIYRPRNQHYEIIIPAAGMGKRMKSYGPKSLISIKELDNTIIGHQIKIIKKLFPKFTIILVVGFECHKLMNYVPNSFVIVENENFETTNVARSIGMGLRASTSDHIIVLYGDLIFNEKMLNCPFDKSCILTNDTMSPEEVGCIVQDGKLENISYDLERKWAQIAYLTGKELSLFKQACWNQNNTKKFGFEMLNEVINRGGNLQAIQPKEGKIIDIDSSSDILRVSEII